MNEGKPLPVTPCSLPFHLLGSERFEQRRGIGPGRYRSPRCSPHLEPSSLEMDDVPFVASSKTISAWPYVGAFQLRRPVADRIHVIVRGGSSPGSLGSRMSRRALGGVALRFPALLT